MLQIHANRIVIEKSSFNEASIGSSSSLSMHVTWSFAYVSSAVAFIWIPANVRCILSFFFLSQIYTMFDPRKIWTNQLRHVGGKPRSFRWFQSASQAEKVGTSMEQGLLRSFSARYVYDHRGLCVNDLQNYKGHISILRAISSDLAGAQTRLKDFWCICLG